MVTAVTPFGADEQGAVRVVVHDPRQLVREGLGELLAATEGVVVVGAVPTVEEAFTVVAASDVDVVVTPDAAAASHGVPEAVLLVRSEDETTVEAVVAAVIGRHSRATQKQHDHRAGAGSWAGHLTPREIEVLELVAAGLATPEVAARMGISRHTVDNYKQSAFTKLDVNSQAQAVSFALRAGLIRLSSDHHETRRA